MGHWRLLLLSLLMISCGDDDKGAIQYSGVVDSELTLEIGSFGAYTHRPVAMIGNLVAEGWVGFFENGTCEGQPAFRQRITAEWLKERQGSPLSVPLSLNFYLQRNYAYSALLIQSGETRTECFSQNFTFDTTAIVAGTSHTCAILNNGTLKCWGEGADGRTGQGGTDNKGDGADEDGHHLGVLHVGGATEGGENLEVKAVALGGKHSCVLMTDDSLRCWGEGGAGQLGNGGVADIGDGAGEMESIEAVPLADGPATVQGVSLGHEHSCALMGVWGETGIKCWGKNRFGQLGLGDANDRGGSLRTLGERLPEVEVGGGESFPRLVSAGGDHTCVVFADGRFKCWGRNDDGQLGLEDVGSRGDEAGEMGDALPYVSLGTGGRVREVSAGGAHTCALLLDGRIKCWGNNHDGQLGLGHLVGKGANKGEMGDSLPYVDLGQGSRAKSVRAGFAHTCALLENGALRCWGKNSKGQLGVGDNRDRSVPTAVDVGERLHVKSVSVGGEHTCALLSDDSMKCWGEGGSGQLLGGNTSDQNAPPDVPLNLDDHLIAVNISVGSEHACALLNHGQVKCWGKNDLGQLGQGDADSVGKTSGDPDDELGEIPPVDLGTDVTARSVAVGERHSCALLNDGSVKCWGANDNGQLGLGSGMDSVDPHVGDDEGEMGDALGAVTFGSRNMVAVQIGAGEDFTCALVSDGSVYCWGVNDVGQLGRGDTDTIGDGETAAEGMVAVAFPVGVVPRSLSVGDRHVCIVGRSGDDNKVYCWGDDSAGQLGQAASVAVGDDEAVSGVTAVDFGTDDTVKAVAAGSEHTCAILVNDELVCWGANGSGQLGRDSVADDEDAPGGTGVDIAHANNTVSRVSLGRAHTCIVSAASGYMECWGANGSGQLAQGNTTNLGDDTTRVDAGTPFNLGRVLKLELGGNLGCAIDESWKIQCWGEGTEGQLGRGNGDNWGDNAAEVPPWSQFLELGPAAQTARNI